MELKRTLQGKVGRYDFKENQRAKISFGERTGERRTDFEKEEKYRR